MEILPIVLDARLTLESLEKIQAAIETPSILVFQGGPDCFCRGLDLSGGEVFPKLQAFGQLLLALRERAAPTIAVVTGDALDGGLGLAAACEFVLATPDARFGMPEVQNGILPLVIHPFLRERIPTNPLRKLVQSGVTVDAFAAQQLGLVDVFSTEPDRLLAFLTPGDPQACRRIKSLSSAIHREVDAACRREAARRSPSPFAFHAQGMGMLYVDRDRRMEYFRYAS
jgi:enoyl-CoA hydratase/carnithine racemase